MPGQRVLYLTKGSTSLLSVKVPHAHTPPITCWATSLGYKSQFHKLLHHRLFLLFKLFYSLLQVSKWVVTQSFAFLGKFPAAVFRYLLKSKLMRQPLVISEGTGSSTAGINLGNLLQCTLKRLCVPLSWSFLMSTREKKTVLVLQEQGRIRKKRSIQGWRFLPFQSSEVHGPKQSMPSWYCGHNNSFMAGLILQTS